MGRLSRADGSAHYELTAETSVGRAANASLRLGRAHVSLQHASVRWTERGWELRDLLSKNGTYVTGQRVAAGTPVRLELGARVAFGSPADVLVVSDISPPRPMLVRADSDGAAQPIFLSESLVGLPSLDDPAVSLFLGESGSWFIESRERTGPLTDGDLISIGSEHWRCCLPTTPDETAMLGATSGALLLADVALRLAVSPDEESVELTVTDAVREISLGQKACHYLLLTLARGRLRQDLPPEASMPDGWLAVGTLLDLLQVSEQHLNVDIFRIRQSLKAAGVLDAVSIVERDAQQRRVRLGTERVAIVRQFGSPSPTPP